MGNDDDGLKTNILVDIVRVSYYIGSAIVVSLWPSFSSLPPCPPSTSMCVQTKELELCV